MADKKLADKFFKDNIEKAKVDFLSAVNLYRDYVGKAKTDDERRRRINRFRCG